MRNNKTGHWHKRQSSFTHMVDCSADRRALPDAADLLKQRDGSVLAQHTILKADHFHRGVAKDKTIKLLHAPNFRKTQLNIYGVAQPNQSGLYTLLTLLGCGPRNPEARACTWFNTREEPLIFVNDEPFVLRELDNPSVNIKAYAGISRERLEQTEERLKQDVLHEATTNGGIVLMHDELGDGRVVPCLVGCERVRTSAEVFAELVQAGYRVDYHRIPMSHGLSPLDPFIDEYIDVFRRVPVADSVVFSCGLGIGRTTFGMLVGLLIRRALALEQTQEDPFRIEAEPPRQDALRLVLVLERALGAADGSLPHQSAIQWLLQRDQILEDLLAALAGNYKCVLDLVRVLDGGVQCKSVVDHAVDRCEDMLNLRESILIGRVRHSVQVPDALETGLAFMERYFTLIALCGYLGEAGAPASTFIAWLDARPEIWNMFVGLRRDANKLKVFLPVVKLTGLTKGTLVLTKEEQEAAYAETNVLKNRSGAVLVPHTILKVDAWSSVDKLPAELDGAANLRRARGGGPVPIWAVAQPRLPAIRAILQKIHGAGGGRLCWINVREEPLVYIHDEPYVLRDKFASLRNLRSYSGIPYERLQLLEARLRDDILAEASLYTGQVLVHAEDPDGAVFPVWEQIRGPDEVATMAHVFKRLAREFPGLEYYRIPVTAEDAPEPRDFDAILRIVARGPLDEAPLALVFNCQIGAGRSTTGQVIAAQVVAWLRRQTVSGPSEAEGATTDTVHFKAVHAILRAIRYGLESKHALDAIVDESAAVVNLRLAVSQWAERAQHAADPIEARKAQRKGVLALKRYCLLLLFQAYLNDNVPDADPSVPMESFAAYIERHPEFVKLLAELDSGRASLETLHTDGPLAVGEAAEGHALTNEVAFVIGNRQGSVLGPMTILKYDHFPGCQKPALSERVEGAPNFREVAMPASSPSASLSIYGMAMPMAQAIRDVLARLSASERGGRSILWISLREEPVVFLCGRPFVLRVVKDPVANIEMTGIVSERVESMEERLKRDALAELQAFGGKILLHEEETVGKGGFELVPVWQPARPDDVATPAEVYAAIGAGGFRVSYARIPITDEQAPIPSVFDLLFRLIWNRPADTDLIFNCQMGRGRTTTGMVMSAIIHLIRNRVPIEPGSSPALAAGAEESQEEASRRRYLAGDYKLVLHLLLVLEHGKQSKRCVDYAIDLCAHVQNLREAIFAFKQQAESPAKSGQQQDAEDIHEMARHYALRYFYLIVFAEFVTQRLAKADQADAADHEFSTWLRDRREILNLVSRPQSFDLS